MKRIRNEKRCPICRNPINPRERIVYSSIAFVEGRPMWAMHIKCSEILSEFYKHHKHVDTPGEYATKRVMEWYHCWGQFIM